MAGHDSIQILRGSQTYDPNQVVLLDGQPFYSKKNKQLYVGDNTQEQLKPVGAANLVPGHGDHSVQQESLRVFTYDNEEYDYTQWDISGSHIEEYINDGTVNLGDYYQDGIVIAGAVGDNSVMLNTQNLSYNNESTTIGQKNIAYGGNSLATGNGTASVGAASFSSGTSTIAKGNSSASFNFNNKALGDNSAAFGHTTTASGYASFSSGHKTIASGNYSAVFGLESTAESDYAVAFGFKNHSTGQRSFSTGNSNTVSGINSFATGANSSVSGNNSFSSGNENNISGTAAAAFGESNSTQGNRSFIQGLSNNLNSSSTESFCGGYSNTLNNSRQSYVFGVSNEINSDKYVGTGNIILGGNNKIINNATASGYNIALGCENEILEATWYAVALGRKNILTKRNSMAFGESNTVSGQSAVAIGTTNTVSANMGFASGNGNTVSGDYYSVAFGQQNTSSNRASFAAGRTSVASGYAATTFGGDNNATHEYSATIGLGLNSCGGSSTTIGKYNSTENDALFVVGNGGGNSNRNNAFVVKSDGTIISPFIVSSTEKTEIKSKKINAGTNNTSDGNYSTAIGNNNKANSYGSTAIGFNNQANGHYSFVAGLDNISSSNDVGLGQSVLGKYSAVNDNAIFVVGNGTGSASSSRKNAFEVLKDGRAKVHGVPVEGTDVLRLKDLNTVFNNYYLSEKLQYTQKGKGVTYVKYSWGNNSYGAPLYDAYTEGNGYVSVRFMLSSDGKTLYINNDSFSGGTTTVSYIDTITTTTLEGVSSLYISDDNKIIKFSKTLYDGDKTSVSTEIVGGARPTVLTVYYRLGNGASNSAGRYHFEITQVDIDIIEGTTFNETASLDSLGISAGYQKFNYNNNYYSLNDIIPTITSDGICTATDVTINTSQSNYCKLLFPFDMSAAQA